MRGVNVRFDSSIVSARWSFVGGAPRKMLRCDRPGHARLIGPTGIEKEWSDPLEALAWMSRSILGHPASTRWMGWISYDLGRLFESIPTRRAESELDWPLFVFSLHAVAAGASAVAVDQAGRRSCAPRQASAPASNFTRREYESAVARAVEYIAAGDIFQVNLSQRFTVPCGESPGAIYRRLCAQSPAAYGALLDYDEMALICNSPELFLRVTPDRRVVTRPIKGTRRLAPGMDDELRRSIKDQAELNMIVDLERNDLGRVCEIGSVRVIEPRVIEAHPTVYHGVATIEGVLRPDVTFVDLLRATFPGGSITGAPKIRAMQIIEELEPVRRGPYCGAIGYLDSDGTIELNIAIRTMLMKAGLVHIPVGGGIVADSVPADEYEETLVKAQALFRCLGIGG